MTADSDAYLQVVPEDTITAWLAQCGPCDAGLPMSCTCPTGDPRSVIAALVIERDALRAMLNDLGRRPSDAIGGTRV